MNNEVPVIPEELSESEERMSPAMFANRFEQHTSIYITKIQKITSMVAVLSTLIRANSYIQKHPEERAELIQHLEILEAIISRASQYIYGGSLSSPEAFVDFFDGDIKTEDIRSTGTANTYHTLMTDVDSACTAISSALSALDVPSQKMQE